MESIRTPSNLELLLHCYTSPEEHPRIDAPGIQEGIDILISHELVKRDQTKSALIYKVTEKGKFYIAHLLEIPFPERTFHIPERQ